MTTIYIIILPPGPFFCQHYWQDHIQDDATRSIPNVLGEASIPHSPCLLAVHLLFCYDN